MGASDYMVGNAPGGASYQMGDMAKQLFDMLKGLPQDYYQGQQSRFQQGQNQRTERLQSLFKDGLPTGPDGQPDVSAISQQLAKSGGAEGAAGQLPFLFKQQILRDENAGDQQSQPPQPRKPSIGPSTSSNGAGPANIIGTQGAQGGRSPNPDGNDTSGGVPTARQMAIDAGLDPTSPNVAAAFKGITLDRELTSDGLVKGVAKRIAELKGGGGDSSPISAGSINQGGEQMGAAGGPVGASGGSPISPAPTAAAGGAQPQGMGGATDMVPRGVDPHAWIAAREKFAEGLEKKARIRETIGIGGDKALLEQAGSVRKEIAAVREQLGKTGPGALGFDVRKTAANADIEQSKKKYDGLQNLGQVGQIGNQKLDRIRSVMSDPNFMSGAGHGIAQAFKQWSVTLGGDPKAAQPMEEFNKTAQQLLTDDIKAMGQSGAGPVRVAEVQIMKQATANLGISPATNRYLVEEAYRVHNDHQAVARLAQQYKEQHGYLDAGWDKVRDAYYEKNPLFTKEELADPRLVSPPMVPREIASDPGKRAVWEKQQGLKSGDPIRTDDGKIRWVR